MKKETKLTYTFNLHSNGILDIELTRSTYWGNISLYESYEESYIHMNFFTNSYYQGFGNINNTKQHVIFDYVAQKR